MPDKKEETKKKSQGCFKITLIVLGILAGFALIIYMLIFSVKELLLIVPQLLPRTQTPAYISVIKDASAEISYARNIKNNSDAADDALFGERSISANFPDGVFPYADSIFNWGKKVNDAASNRKLASAPDEPDSFQLSLSNKDAIDVYNDITADIDHLKTFGDYAYAKENRDELYWIAARLHADEILLNALTNVKITDSKTGPEDIAYAATIYGSTCYYGRGHVMVFSGINKGDCLQKLSTGVDIVRRAAQAYASGKADDATDWNAGWSAIAGGGYPIDTTGVTVGDDNFATPPAMVAFQNACKAIGGQTPAGATMDRLPTSESGQICTYKGPKGGFCWIFQTDSDKNYAGGDGDCPQENLLPVNTKVPNPQPGTETPSGSIETPSQNNRNNSTPVSTATPGQNFNGTYSGNSSVATGVSQATITVSGNSLSGSGTFVGPYSASIGITIKGTVDDSGNVSGGLSGSGTVAGYDVSGRGSFSGKTNDNTMSINYNVSGSGGGISQSYSGTIILTKH